MLLDLYPQHPWNKCHFMKKPNGFWNSKANQLDFMKILEGKLNITDFKDWYQVSKMEIEDAGIKTH